MKTLITNANCNRLLLDGSEDQELVVNVLIEEGKITDVSEDVIAVEVDQVIDATGLFLSPGLIDPQVHFREPGMEYKEDIASGSKAAVKGGFTGVVSMPNTSPTADCAQVVEFMVNKALEAGLCHVYPTGALSFGLAGETLTDFSELKRAGAVAITDDGKGVQNSALFKQALEQAKAVDLPILDHSEDEDLSAQGAIHLGQVSEQYKVKGIDANSESAHVIRGCQMSEETGAHYHVLHVSTESSINAVRAAKATGVRVTVEVSPHHLLLCDQDIKVKQNGELDANWKMNPPLRSLQDKLACQQALLDGTIDAIATDHAPHSPEEKALPIEQAPFGIIGLETAFPLMYSHFVKTDKLTLPRLIDLMSKQAGALFGIECGRMTKGSAADLALFDLTNEFTVSENFFASKSKNSPFIGERLTGATSMTMVSGKVVYQRATLAS